MLENQLSLEYDDELRDSTVFYFNVNEIGKKIYMYMSELFGMEK